MRRLNYISVKARAKFWAGSGLLLFGALLIAGCQTDDLKPAGASKSKGAEVATAKPGDGGYYNQTLGAGSVRVGYLGVRRSDQAARQADSEARDGAALAVNSLGSSLVKLTMLESAETLPAIETAARSLASQGIGVLMTTARGAELSAVQAAMVGRDIPVISFETNDATLPENVYPFRSSLTDSLLEGSTFALAEGATHAMVIAGSQTEVPAAERLAQQMKAFGAKVEPVALLSGSDLPARSLASWSKVDVLIIMPGVKTPAIVLKKADSAKPPRPGRRLVASTVLLPADLSDAKMTGAIVCRYDQNIEARLGRRYMASYGLPASTSAAYGFDAMAMIIGLVNVWGDGAFAPERLRSPSGFSGALGIFRFEDNGNVRRNCDIFKVAKGSYVFFQKAPPTL